MHSWSPLDRSARLCVLVAVGLVGSVVSTPFAAAPRYRAELTGFEVVPPVLGPATGRVRLFPGAEPGTVRYELRLDDLEGQPIAAAIHFAPPRVNGAPIAFLCLTLIFVPPEAAARGPIPLPPVPACPVAPGGIVTDTLNAARVFGSPEQGLDYGDLHGLLELLNAGQAYVSVTTTRFPAGALRGQLRRAHAPGD